MVIERKTIAHKYSQLIVLPKYWIEMQNLQKGDLIQMEIDTDGNLILKGKKNVTGD